MDRLKEFIHNNREAFGKEELEPVHVMRFESKLRSRRKRVRRYVRYSLAVAASVAILLLSVPPFSRSGQTGATPAACQTAADINNLRVYYTMQMDEIITRIKDATTCNRLEKKQLLEESDRIMKANRQFEQHVIPQMPCSQETLYAMTQLYNTSLESLNFMLQQIENNSAY